MYLRKIRTTTLITTTIIALLTVLAIFLLHGIVLSQTATNTGEILVKKGENYQVNTIPFNQVEYIGECPGKAIQPDMDRAYFISPNTLPAPQQRVVIQNVTTGMDDNPYPYTNRKYDTGKYSEGFIFGLDSRHRGRTFSVQAGENEFRYEIKQKDKIIESGSLTAQVLIRNKGAITRQKNCSSEYQCNQPDSTWPHQPEPSFPDYNWPNSLEKEESKIPTDPPPEILNLPELLPQPSDPFPVCNWVTRCQCSY